MYVVTVDLGGKLIYFFSILASDWLKFGGVDHVTGPEGLKIMEKRKKTGDVAQVKHYILLYTTILWATLWSISRIG